MAGIADHQFAAVGDRLFALLDRAVPGVDSAELRIRMRMRMVVALPARRAPRRRPLRHHRCRGPLASRPLLTVFGQYNDPLKLQPRWKALFPAARQEIVPKGNHFPMCDAPEPVARWIRQWHSTDVAQAR